MRYKTKLSAAILILGFNAGAQGLDLEQQAYLSHLAVLLSSPSEKQEVEYLLFKNRKLNLSTEENIRLNIILKKISEKVDSESNPMFTIE